MKKNIMLNVKGLRRANDEDDESVDFTTEAVFYSEDGFHAVEYKESELTGMEGTLTRIEFRDGGVSIIRTGTNASQLIFERGRRHVTMYETEVGTLEVAVCSDSVEANFDDGGGEASFDYYLEVNGRETSYNEFEMKIREIKYDESCSECQG